LFVTAINKKGKTVFKSSAGMSGFKGSSKMTPYVNKKNGIIIRQKMLTLGCKKLEIILKSSDIFTEWMSKSFKNPWKAKKNKKKIKILSINDRCSHAYSVLKKPRKRKLNK